MQKINEIILIDLFLHIFDLAVITSQDCAKNKMKKIIIFFIGLITLTTIACFIFYSYYFSDEKIQERKIETWNKRVNEFKNSKSGRTALTNDISLRWTIKDFDSKNHQIEYCENEHQDATYICSIDNELWYGSDFRMDLPKNELKSLTIYIDKKYIKLNVSQMFNPNLNGELTKEQFKIEKHSEHYILYGFFSDGAGTYTTNWKIYKGKSERGKISKDEQDFNWQNTN